MWLKSKLILIALILMLTADLRSQSSFLQYFGTFDNDDATTIYEFKNRYYFTGYGTPRYFVVIDDKGSFINLNTSIPHLFIYHNCLVFYRDTILAFGAGGDLSVAPSLSKFSLNGTLLESILYSQVYPKEGSIFYTMNDTINNISYSIGLGGQGNTNLMSFQKIDLNGNLLHFTLVGGSEGYDRPLGMFPKKGSSDFLVFTQTELFTIDSMGVLKERRLHQPIDIRGKKVELLDIIQEPDSSFTSIISGRKYFLDHTAYFRHDTSGIVNVIDSLPIQTNSLKSPIMICKSNDGGYVLASSVMYKVDSTMKLQWINPIDDDITLKKIAQAADGGYYGCGEKYFEATKLDYFIFKTLPDGRILTGNEEVKQLKPYSFNIYPNPAHSVFNITGTLPLHGWRLMDASGKQMLNGTLNEVNTTSLAPGVYLLEIQHEAGVYYKKIVLY